MDALYRDVKNLQPTLYNIREQYFTPRGEPKSPDSLTKYMEAVKSTKYGQEVVNYINEKFGDSSPEYRKKMEDLYLQSPELIERTYVEMKTKDTGIDSFKEYIKEQMNKELVSAYEEAFSKAIEKLKQSEIDGLVNKITGWQEKFKQLVQKQYQKIDEDWYNFHEVSSTLSPVGPDGNPTALGQLQQLLKSYSAIPDQIGPIDRYMETLLL
jgi:hypothetical protein